MSIQTLPHTNCGKYVVYKDTVQVIVKVMLNGRFQLLNPLKGNTKITVLPTNATGTNYTPMTLVAYSDSFYLVSRLGTIISLTTGRVMQWANDSHSRTDIMELFNGH